MKTLARTVFCGLLLVMLLAGCQNSRPTPPKPPVSFPNAMASIDGQPVTDAEWHQTRRYAEITLRLLGEPGAELDQAQVLKSTLEDRVIELEAQKDGFRVSSASIDAEQARLLQVAGVSEDALRALWADVGLSEAQWRQELARTVLAGRYLEDIVLADVPPGDRAQTRAEWLATAQKEHAVTILSQPQPVTGLSIGNLAPDFTLPTLTGSPLRLSDLRGKVVLLNFWATWCYACRQEMPLLMDSYRQHQSQDFVVVGVDVGEAAPQIQDFIDELQITFPIVLDADQSISRQYRVFGLPTSFLLDRQGVIDYVFVGALHPPQWEDALQQTLAK
ncbi:MAG: redoxin domain-containing protein [Chloroflexi bacterium]|nr:redoxin domain-containing protein [Chloroflexota bacterium]